MKRLISLVQGLVILISIAFLSIINLIIITRTTNVTIDHGFSERVSVLPTSLISGLIFIALLGGGLLFHRWAKRLSPKWLFICCSLIILVVGISLIMTASPVLRADQKSVLEAAININRQNYSDFKPVTGYLNKYPYQLGFVSFERLIIAIFGQYSVTAIYSLNLISVLGINFTLWRLTHRLTGNRAIENYQIILNAVFLPELLFILFAYGTLLGFSFLVYGTYFAIRQWQDNHRWDWLIAACCLVIAYQFKSNYSIGIIAIIAWSLVAFIKRHHWQSLALIIASLFFVVASNQALNHYYSSLTGHEVNTSKGVPKNLFVVMGMSPNYYRSGGWYNRYTVNIYQYFHGNYDRSAEQGYKDLDKRLSKMSDNLYQTTKFFERKVTTTWSDPTFQSVWLGPHLVYHQKVKNHFWRTVYNDPRSLLYRSLFNFGHAWYILIMLTVLIGTLKLFKYRRTVALGSLVLITYFIGGVVFHFLWETKSQYVINYVIALVPIAAIGAEAFFRNLTEIIRRNLAVTGQK